MVRRSGNVVLRARTVWVLSFCLPGTGCGGGSERAGDLDTLQDADDSASGPQDALDPDPVTSDVFPADVHAPDEMDVPPMDNADAGAALPCPTYADAVVAATVTAEELHEVSGLAASRAHPGILWAQNDSGSGPRLYAIGLDGQVKGRFDLEGVTAHDWEDIARGPLDGLQGDAIFVADVGDNGRNRPFVSVYVVAEPSNLQAEPPGILPVLASMPLVYPAGPEDCEAVFVDPLDGALYLVTKTGLDGGLNPVYRKKPPHVTTTAPVVLEEVARIPSLVATGASVSEDGSVLVVRNPLNGVLYRRTAGQSVEEALAATPCELPFFTGETTGEAIALHPRAFGFWSISEFGSTSRQDLHWTAVNW